MSGRKYVRGACDAQDNPEKTDQESEDTPNASLHSETVRWAMKTYGVSKEEAEELMSVIGG